MSLLRLDVLESFIQCCDIHVAWFAASSYSEKKVRPPALELGEENGRILLPISVILFSQPHSLFLSRSFRIYLTLTNSHSFVC